MSERLKVCGLNCARGGRLILRDIDFTVAPGTWVGIIGPNGGGKSTLLKAILGQLPVESGEVELDGAGVLHHPLERAAGVGFAPEITELPDMLTVGEVFRVLEVARGRSRDLGVAPLVGEALGVEALLPLRIYTLSCGLKQRVCLYLAFLGAPKVVLLDEPFNWLDPLVALRFRDCVRQVVGVDGLAVVAALHDVGATLTRCDEGFLLRGGRIVRRFGSDELARARTNVDAFERNVAASFEEPTSVTA